MTRVLSASLLLLAVATVGCKKEQAEPTATATPSTTRSKDPVAAEVKDGVQAMTITVSDMGYAPGSIELKAGVPVRLTFDQQSKSECASQIQIPSMGVPVTDLPFGKQTTVEFTPKEGGSFNFACGMNMMKGTILVKG